MWSMWDAPSDRDYYDQFNPFDEELDEPEESANQPMPVPIVVELSDEECPF